jgi:ferredoxin
MTRQLPFRQCLRKAAIILMFLTFPITMNFFFTLCDHRWGHEWHYQRQFGNISIDVCFFLVPGTCLVQLEYMENSECVLCGTCVDNCAKSAIHYAFSAGK